MAIRFEENAAALGGRSWPLRESNCAGKYKQQNRMEEALHFSTRIAEVELKVDVNPYVNPR
jgi:hypothetical protein